MRLTQTTYEAIRFLPAEERYELTAQIRRSAVSVPSNIAEGCGRNSRRELFYFIGVAVGSLNELETQLELAHSFYDLPDAGRLFEGLNATKAKLLRFRASVQNQLAHDRN